METIADHDTGLFGSIEQIMDANQAAAIAVRQLIGHLSPILPDGVPEEIEGLLDEANLYHLAEPGNSAFGYLARSQSRRTVTIADAVNALREAIRL